LMLVFPRLVAEGWLKADELAGIGPEKVDVINMMMSLRNLRESSRDVEQ